MVATAVALAALVLALTPVTTAGALAPRLPDLGMASLSDFRIDTFSGVRRLRFTTEIVNVGAGPFLVSGRRPASSGGVMSSVRQQVVYDNGAVGSIRTQAVMDYSGDDHDHWHVRDLERYSITRVGSARELGRGAKVGFCFLDSHAYRLSLPGAPPAPVYGSAGCGSQGSTSVDMGLSVGWGDIYPSGLTLQWIDIAGLPSGEYVVRAQADPNAVFTEVTRANNLTWTRVHISDTNQVTVLEQGPAA